MKKLTKKLLACGLSVLTLSSMPIYGANTTPISTTASTEISKSILTLEDAINAALSNNNDLSLKTNKDKLYEEQLKYTDDLSTLTYQTLYTSRRQNEQQKEFLKDKISHDITSRYYTIILAEKEIENLEQDIALKKRELETLEIKQKLGLATKLEIQAKQVELGQLISSKTTKLGTLASNKTNFKLITGKDLDKYTLEGDFVLDKLDVNNNVEGFINSKIGTYLKFSKELADIQLDHMMDNFLYQGPTVAQYEEVQYNTKSTILNLETTEDTLKETLTTLYSNLINLEEQINIMKPQVDLLENQVATTKLQYELGLATKLQYDTVASNLKDLEYAYDSLIYNYNNLKGQIEKPWVIKALG